MLKKPVLKKVPAKAAAVVTKPPVASKKAAMPSRPVSKAGVKSALAVKPAASQPVAVEKKSAPAPASELISDPITQPVLPSRSPILPVSTGTALSVSAQSSAGSAANGNTHAANILIVVTAGGWPVTDLSKDHFTLMEHFEVPGQLAPFSNNITSFRNAGSGVYLIQTKPINGAPWRTGHHLGQVLVSTGNDFQGQAIVKIIIR